MSRSRKTSKSLKVASRLDTAAAPKLLDALVRRRDGHLTIDLTEVRWIGAACAEILMSAVKTWDASPYELTFTAPTDDFNDGMRILGLDHLNLSIRTLTS
jgi:chemotaxis protein CheX